jgi:hypothetical protein
LIQRQLQSEAQSAAAARLVIVLATTALFFGDAAGKGGAMVVSPDYSRADRKREA